MAIDEAITLKKLEVFLAFMSDNNMARVSEKLGQSTVSVHRALHSLEEAMRCPLFKREGRNLIPLPTAHALTDYAKRAIQECEQGIEKVRELSGFHGTRLRIGAMYSLTLRCIPELVIGLKLRKPELDIDLTLGSNRELLQNMADGKLDAVVIGIQNAALTQELVAVPLFNDEMYLAAPIGSAYAHCERINLQDLREEKFITLRDGFATTTSFHEAFQSAGFAPQISMRVADIFSLINLVSGGVGYSLLPGRVSAFSSHIQLIPLASKYTSHQQIALLVPKNREREPNLLALIAECRMQGQRYQQGMRGRA